MSQAEIKALEHIAMTHSKPGGKLLRPAPPAGWVPLQRKQVDLGFGCQASVCPNCGVSHYLNYDKGGTGFADPEAQAEWNRLNFAEEGQVSIWRASFWGPDQGQGKFLAPDGTRLIDHWSHFSYGHCRSCGLAVWQDYGGVVVYPDGTYHQNYREWCGDSEAFYYQPVTGQLALAF